MVKKCPMCNHYISDTVSVCPHCGNNINSEEFSSSNVQERSATDVTENNGPSTQNSEFQDSIIDDVKKSRKYKRFIIPIVIGCLLFVGIVLGIRNYSFQDKQESLIVSTDNVVEIMDSVADEPVIDISFSVIPVSFGQETDDIYAKVSIDYPQTDNESLQEAIVSFIVKALINDFTWGENPRPNYNGDINDGQAIAEFFVNDKVREISEERTRDSIDSVPWEEDISIKKICETERLVSYVVDFGGSHGGVGGGTNYGITFRKDDGNIINVIDYSSKTQMKPLLVRYVNSFIDDDEVVLNNEFSMQPFPAKEPFITEKGIRFIYQKYEIGPGALGVVDITIPFSDIADFMSEDALSLIGYEK